MCPYKTKLGSSLNVLNPPEPNVIPIYNKERGRRKRLPLSLLYITPYDTLDKRHKFLSDDY